MKTKHWWLMGACLLVLLVASLAAMVGLRDATHLTLHGIAWPLSAAPDGEYEGHYKNTRFSNTVTVTLKDHQIVGIDIVKDVAGSGITNCAQEIFRRVLGSQDTLVDTVAGATATSKAYLKAIENALDPKFIEGLW